ncbi:MAG: hypothetical protein RLZZ58_444, partial [Pseudomonadota bacterium]
MFALALTACQSAVPDAAADKARAAAEKGTLRRAMDADVKSLDPQKVSDLASLRVAADQFDGLTRFDGSGAVVPALAARWLVSADGRVWRFTMDPERRFSDGTAITASIWAASFARLRKPATLAPAASLFDPIAAVMVPDNRTIVIRLHAPFPALPALLAHPAAAALPLHRIAARGGDWTADRPMVTSGAYRTRKWVLNRALELESSPFASGRRAQPPRVTWIPIDDPLTGIRAFATNQIDILSEFPASRVAALRAEFGTALHNSPSLGTYYFAFNTRRPPFADVRIRRALAMVVDRDWIARNIVGAGVTPADALVPPDLSSATPRPFWAGWSKTKKQAEARALLAAAGYGPARPLVFDIRFNSSAEHRRVAVALAAMWRPLNVEARMFNSEASLHFA